MLEDSQTEDLHEGACPTLGQLLGGEPYDKPPEHARLPARMS